MIETMDFIFIWLGRIFVFLLLIAVIIGLIAYILNKLSICTLGMRALMYHILSFQKNINERSKDMIRMKKGSRWYIVYRNKEYLWECIQELDKNGK